MAKRQRDPMDPVALGNHVVSSEIIGDCTIEASASDNGCVSYSLHHKGTFWGCSRYESTILATVRLINGGVTPEIATRKVFSSR